MDCADSDCVGNPACAPPAPENCTNDLDDDRDGEIDCADPDCATNATCRAQGNCENDADAALLDTIDVETVAQDCIFECLAGFDRTCLRECVQTNTGASAGCSDCFAEYGNCAGTRCLTQCVGGFNATCEDCLADNCSAQFETCAGFGF